jgi:hypothetical protein
MYDMYPWDSTSQGEYPPQPLRSWRNPSRQAPRPRDGSAPNGSAANSSAAHAGAANGGAAHARDISPAQAIQIALDRRDNGGDASPAPAATAPAASPASQARQ